MTRPTLELPGLNNYAVKRNFRRDLDQEMRREGHDYFVPNTNIAIGGQPFPGLRRVTGIARVGATATVTIALGHHFEEGETILINGAVEAEYNGEFVITNITATAFDYTVTGTPATPATGSITSAPIESLNLFHQARRPNGKNAVIAGSERRLYRYFGLDDGEYFSIDPNDYPAGQTALYVSTDPADYPVGEIPAYVDNDPGEWIVIGWGYKTWAEGAHRWEADSINGTSIFNNGIDLPQSYRVEDIVAIPVYELREQGVAFVGTIADSAGIQTAADIAEIHADKIEDLFAFKGTLKSGNLTATQAVNTVTTPDAFFTADMVGKTIIYNDDTETTRNITAFIDSKNVTVDGAATTISPGETFSIRTKADQPGSLYSGLITGSQPAGSAVVTASGAIFLLTMVGKRLRFTNGFSREIIGFISPTQVTLDAPVNPDTVTALPFWIVSNPEFASPDYIVTAAAPIFTDDMVGLNLVWDTGQVRKIKALAGVAPTSTVYVDTDLPVPLGFFGWGNLDTYAPYEMGQYVNRIQYRFIWSLPDEPTRWGATVPGSITAGQHRMQLKYPVKSFSNGEEIIITGAGVNGGNLITTIAYISALGSVMLLADAAETTVEDVAVTRTDTIGSILGFADLQGDSSGIVKMLGLQDTLVIYKDTDIFLANFTGSPDTPWNFRQIRVPLAKNLYYRFTLTLAQGLFHVYAGRSSFYRFDLTTRQPTEIPSAELVSNLFFDVVTIERTNEIFAADNSITNETFVVVPTEGEDKVICADYLFGTISTSNIAITGAGTMKRPETGISIGETEDWFVMGTARGVALVYGKADGPQPFWSNAREIFYRREANPYNATKGAYVSTLHGGMASFGSPFNEKDLLEYLPYLASQSPNTTFLVELYGTRNTPETPSLLASRTFTNPVAKNLMPVFFRKNYFQDRLTVTGLDNPFRLAMRTWRGFGLQTRSIIRRP